MSNDEIPATPPVPPRAFEEPWVVGVLYLLVPPVGLFLLAKSRAITRDYKIATVVLTAIFLVFVAVVESASGELAELRDGFLAQANHRAALGLLREDRLDQAEAAAEAASSYAPDDPYLQYTRARIARKRGNSAEERRWLKTAVTRKEKLSEKSPPRWRVELGTHALAAGELDRVDEILTTLKGTRAKDAGAPILKAGRLRLEGRLGNAAALARRPVEDFHLMRFGEAYIEMARTAAAGEDYRRAAYLGLEGIRHGGAGDLPAERALVLEWAAQAGLDPAPVGTFLKALELRGVTYRPDEVDEDGAAAAHELLGHLLEKVPRFFARDLVLHTRGSYLFYQKKKYDEALKIYEVGATASPGGAVACRCTYQIFRCREELEDLLGAEKAAFKVMQGCPGDLALRTTRRLGKLRKKAKKAKKAAEK